MDSVEGQMTMDTVEPIMLATHEEENQVQFPRDRMKAPDPLSDVQSLQNYFPTSGLTTTRPGCLAFSPVYPRGPQRRVTFSFGSSANDLIQI